MAFGVIMPAFQGVRQAEQDVESQQAAVMALDKLFHQAAFSDHRSVAYDVAPERTILSFLSIEPCSVSGTAPLPPSHYTALGQTSSPLVWNKFVVVVFEPETQLLTLREYPYSGGSALASLNKDALGDVLLEPPAGSKVLARGISDFKLSLPRPRVLHLEIESLREARVRDRRTRLNMDIAMRQGL